MPSGGFKLLDSAEVKMAFSGYTMFLGSNTLSQSSSSSNSNNNNNSSWFSKGNKPCLALTANEAKQTDRANFNTNHICAVALCTATQVAPSAATGSTPSPSSKSSGKDASSSSSVPPNTPPPPKFDQELISAVRTHRMNRDQCALGEVYSLNPPLYSSSSTIKVSSARTRDVETVVLKPPAVVAVGMYNNIATLFAFVDPASHLPKASSPFQNGISDSEKIVPVQSIRFNVRCTAFTTFTTHVDYNVAHGLAPSYCYDSNINNSCGSSTGGDGENNNNNNNNNADADSDEQQERRNPNNRGNNAGPFQPASELWSVFGFGSGDLVIWSHAQEAMLKRHNNCSTSSSSTKDSSSSSDQQNSSSSASSPSQKVSASSAVEPGVAVSAIARVDRGLSEQATCAKWAATKQHDPNFNTQVTCFCDLVVGYENGTILVVSLNATGGFVNQKLSGWFGFSAIRSIQACPIAPYLLGVGSDDGSLRFMAFPWSFDVESFERELMGVANGNHNNITNNNIRELNATDIGTNRDPRVLCSVSGAVSGGGITCIAWEAHGEAVVCTGDDDAVSIVSIESNPSLRNLRDLSALGETTAGLLNNSSSSSSTTGGSDQHHNQNQTSSSPSHSSLGIVKNTKNGMSHNNNSNNVAQAFSLSRPIEIRATAIHRRNFHRSWICGSMILSLEVMNTNPRTDTPELRTVTAVYTAALDGAVVAGAAFPATQILSNHASNGGATGTGGGAGGGGGVSPTTKLPKNETAFPSKQQQHGSNNETMTRHSSISPTLAAVGSRGGLAIRHRPLARFLQMARSDTVLNFAPVGDYDPDFCPCCCATGAKKGNPKYNLAKEQRKRSFVTITAKGTVALWVFYDLSIEDDQIKEA